MRCATPLRPSYSSEHRRLKPVMEAARRLDVGTNPASDALFEAICLSKSFGWFPDLVHAHGTPGRLGSGCAHDVSRSIFQSLRSSAGSSTAEYVASVNWHWDDETIVGLNLSTAAYALADRLPDIYTSSETRKAVHGKPSIFNRPEDIAWAMKQIHRLFKLANVPTPPIFTNQE